MKRATREWVKKAEADHRAVARLALEPQPLHDLVCFHAQQCAEKYLKAIMEELGQVIPKTHDLLQLVDLLLANFPNFRSFRRGMDFLTQFAVDTRYPGANASKRQAASAQRWAEAARDACRAILFPKASGKQSP